MAEQQKKKGYGPNTSPLDRSEQARKASLAYWDKRRKEEALKKEAKPE